MDNQIIVRRAEENIDPDEAEMFAWSLEELRVKPQTAAVWRYGRIFVGPVGHHPVGQQAIATLTAEEGEHDGCLNVFGWKLVGGRPVGRGVFVALHGTPSVRYNRAELVRLLASHLLP